MPAPGRAGGGEEGNRPRLTHGNARVRECPRQVNKRECPRQSSQAEVPAGSASAAQQERRQQTTQRECPRETDKQNNGKRHTARTEGQADADRRAGQDESEKKTKKANTGRQKAQVRGQPSGTVSGKVGVRVGVTGVSRAVAMESGMPGGMDPGGIAAEERSECRLGVPYSWAACFAAAPSEGLGSGGTWRAHGKEWLGGEVSGPMGARFCSGRGLGDLPPSVARPATRALVWSTGGAPVAVGGGVRGPAGTGAGAEAWRGGAGSMGPTPCASAMADNGTGGGGVGGRRVPVSGGLGSEMRSSPLRGGLIEPAGG